LPEKNIAFTNLIYKCAYFGGPGNSTSSPLTLWCPKPRWTWQHFGA